MIYTYPLNWPDGYARSRSQIAGGFKVELAQAEIELDKELERLGAKSTYLASDNELSMTGRPKSQFGNYRSPAVVLHFVRSDQELVMPCDQFTSFRDNVRALGLSIAAIRSLERYGTSALMDRALSSFAALPASATGGEPYVPPQPWYDVLNVSPQAPAAVVEAAGKALLKTAHPDSGGSSSEFVRIQQAMQEGMAARQ